jgi:membrane protein DedA with SNARE-associated domain
LQVKGRLSAIDGIRVKISKYWHYGLTVSFTLTAISAVGLANAYFRFLNITSYHSTNQQIPYSHLLAGYVGVFFLRLLPIPDFITVPLFGYLSSIHVFNPVIVFFVALAGAILPIEYLAGRFAARPIMLKVLSIMKIKEGNVEVAERWLLDHGNFSIFMATFIPYFYSVAAFAAGTLKMRVVPYMAATTLGFGIRYALLEYIGYYGVYILSPKYDYSNRDALFAILAFTSVYYGVYAAQVLRKYQKSQDDRIKNSN